MHIYYFTGKEFGMLAIKKRRLKVSRIEELNDPFEFLGWNLQEPGIRRRLKEWREKRNTELGIVCFARKWSHPLLWGHYADKHRGIGLGFEVPDDGDLYNKIRSGRSVSRRPRAVTSLARMSMICS